MDSLCLFKDFFRRVFPLLKRMGSPTDPWLSFVLVVFFGLLLFLRIKFPNVSKNTETAALAITIVTFLAVCHVFLTHRG